jgi:hypothetical protein
MNDFRLDFSQVGSFIKMDCVCRFVTLLCEFGAFSFWQKWDVHKIGGKLKRFHQLMCKI